MTHLSRPNFTAFMGQRLLAAGPLAEVALAVMNAGRRPAAPPIVIFSDVTGRPIDLDLRGTDREIIARLPQPAPELETAADETAAAEPRGRGRPRLGVVAREVTLLPRHWEWLAGFEEASRALFADDRRRFVGLVAGWPDDIRDHVVKLAFSDHVET
jgi:hypothetical protein